MKARGIGGPSGLGVSGTCLDMPHACCNVVKCHGGNATAVAAVCYQPGKNAGGNSRRFLLLWGSVFLEVLRVSMQAQSGLAVWGTDRSYRFISPVRASPSTSSDADCSQCPYEPNPLQSNLCAL